MDQYSPEVLAFNGKTAAKVFFGEGVEYGHRVEAFGKTSIFVLPSTSGAANGFWDESLWRELADWLNALE